ncbi:MAG: helix-turn-helix domain-containing protein [Opitutaceae bacterium]
MLTSPEFLRETHLIGRRCQEHMLDSAHHPVLRNAHLIWVGDSTLFAPYRMVRLRSVHSHIVVSLAGRGRTLIDGRAVEWRPGQILLAPVGAHHAFEIEGKGPWRLAWAFYDDTPARPAIPGRRPELVDADGRDFVSSLQMLTREAAGIADPARMAALVTLLDSSARRLAGTDQVDQRLWRLWDRVESDLAHAWTVAEMAKIACMSAEHLRRLCHRHHQRSPLSHLTHLRLRRASTMLRNTPEKLEEIALRVGYGSMYSFSTAFRRWSGLPPARFRRGA